ncbi:MAG: TlpA family protein disulfide reductase, partial [Bacteroidia bacterium]|nr:TlpA family protein disulfide reductase [Bacteroidia bacterium]
AVQLGQPAPDIVLPDVDGKTRKLSDLKGSIVLLDFWASWCGPCRRANPHVVETYHKYKEQGFTVFSVSLDGLDARTKSRFPEAQLDEQMKKQKQRWLDAIAKDKLEWDWHVSDLKKWDSSGAATYGVRSIPTTFLIDRDGNIAALNPRNNLEEEIKKII